MPCRARCCRSRSSSRWPLPRIRTSRMARTSTPTNPTISSSATPSRPAASISRPRKSWGKPRPTSKACVRFDRRGELALRRPAVGVDSMKSLVPLFRMEGISKRYGGVRALQQADLDVRAGRVHAILGENGAGKSTLIKIMSGVVAPDEGRMLLEGREVSFPDPAAAVAAGIVCIFQELSLIPDLSVADNIVASNPPGRFGLIDRRAQRRLAEAALARAGGEDIHPMALVRDLPLSRRQIIEIARALTRTPRVLILDEATSALAAADVKRVFEVLKRLRAEGIALLYISHRMHEIAELADDCSVFRNGRRIATYQAGTKSDNEVVEMMIGREYSHVFPAKPAAPPPAATPVLEVRHLSWTPRLNDISFSARAGEVVGLGGLDGQGQREFLLALFGVLRGIGGEVLIDGRPVRIS